MVLRILWDFIFVRRRLDIFFLKDLLSLFRFRFFLKEILSRILFYLWLRKFVRFLFDWLTFLLLECYVLI